MKRSILFSFIMIITASCLAQVPDDALKFSWLSPSGTARNQAVGGAMGSLGGDITATFVNPAGIGLYKTGEVVLSPGFNFLNNKSTYRENTTSVTNNSFNLGTSGLVIGFSNRNSKLKSGAFSLAVNRTANFNTNIDYNGSNNFSSYSEQYASELANSKIPIGKALDFDAPLSLGTKMAVYSYLIDTATRNGSLQVIGLPERLLERGQQNYLQTKGGITEIALGLAGNMNDKFFFGGSIGIPIVNYEKTSTFTERDLSGNINNNFDYSTLRETYTTKGIGLNAKAGIIFKPVEDVRLGLSLHSPTIYGLQDTYSGNMATETENYPPSPGLVEVNSATVSGNELSQYKYDLISPWKVLLSGSYMFHEVEDVGKQRGFISADVEYVNYKAAMYQTADENATDNTYYTDINNSIDNLYKGSFNFKVGGELKFETIMVRAGFAHYGNPYEDAELDAGRNFISGGVGYRDKGFFVDLTYVHGMQKNVNFPYRLSDKPNTFAAVNGTSANVLLTVGFKF
ncbi:MAG: hypothetical protein WKF89_08430 [Chitinophagaceae bacterium]